MADDDDVLVAPKKRKYKKRATSTPDKYPGLRDDIQRLLQRRLDDPDAADGVNLGEIYQEFPEASRASINYHIAVLMTKKITAKVGSGTYKIRTAGLKPKPEPGAPLAVPTRARQAQLVIAPSTYVGRQMESIILRMQNANEAGQLFTQIDFDVMRHVVESKT